MARTALSLSALFLATCSALSSTVPELTVGSASVPPFDHVADVPMSRTATDAAVYTPPPAEDHRPGRLLEEKKPKRKFCNTTKYGLKGDYAYEACGAFCKQAKAVNHCKFCKCKACTFCPAAAAGTSPATPAGASAVGKAGKPAKALRKAQKVQKKEKKAEKKAVKKAAKKAKQAKRKLREA